MTCLPVQRRARTGPEWAQKLDDVVGDLDAGSSVLELRSLEVACLHGARKRGEHTYVALASVLVERQESLSLVPNGRF